MRRMLIITCLLSGSGQGFTAEARPSGQVVMRTAENCPACRRFEAEVIPRLIASGWHVGSAAENHLRIEQVRTGIVPEFVVYREGEVVSRWTGFLSHQQFIAWMNRCFPAPPAKLVDRNLWNYEQESLLQ
ncbi:hypothetical protein [Rubinisphaera margarita]|uniref:hypothetical protein n=1 Tax=Rubinisphaera margarita TaxID=2909586 RepID=UPI001EE9A0AF|nr:hypothetical protein [Rubinisphaera margarita]MCG6157131.1 hypothetical protein [Rubinisphaera margarita]